MNGRKNEREPGFNFGVTAPPAPAVGGVCLILYDRGLLIQHGMGMLLTKANTPVADVVNQRLIMADHQQRTVLPRGHFHQQFNGLLLGQQIEA